MKLTMKLTSWTTLIVIFCLVSLKCSNEEQREADSRMFAQDKVWFTGTYDAAKAKAKKEDKLLLINFFQDG